MKARCTQCRKASTAKTLEKNEGLCPRCHSVRNLLPYDDAGAVAIVVEIRHSGANWDGVLQGIRKRMQPPPFARRWALAFEWHSLDVHELGTRGWRFI